MTIVKSKTTNIECGYAGPNEMSKMQVGGGVYSVSKRSNVPYVGLVGSAGYRKTITWGEIAEVPDNQLVTVRNDSYHGGDIFLNRGADRANCPARITVPVGLRHTTVPTGEGDESAWILDMPCDVRGAHRAYLNIDAFVTQNEENVDGLTMFVRGRRLAGSMKTANILGVAGAPFGPAVGYLSALNYQAGEALSGIPLGQGAAAGDDTRPHSLLDTADVVIFPGGGPDLDEILTWPADSTVWGFPSVTAPDFPGCWYVIEYL